jgi:putative transposase
MESPLATPEKRVKETEVNIQEEIWKFIASTLKQGLKRLLVSFPEDEVTGKVNAKRYEGSTHRQGYRGSCYLRDLVTRYGLMEDLRVPRMAKGPADFELFDKYQRRRSDVDATIGRFLLKGVNARRLKSIARDLFGKEVSTTTVSKTVAYLNKELQNYQIKPLTGDYHFYSWMG